MQNENVLFIGGTNRQSALLRKALPVGYSLQVSNIIAPKEVKTSNTILVYHDPLSTNGLELVRVLKGLENCPPVIVAGHASTPQNEVAEAFRLGASDFLFLPFEMEALSSCLYRFSNQAAIKNKQSWWTKILPGWLTQNGSNPVYSFSNGIVSRGSHHVTKAEPKFEARADLQVQMMGQLRVIVHGEEIRRLPGKKARSLLAYLLHKYPRTVHREQLIDRFWTDSTLDSARNCLNVTLHAIRRSFNDVAPGKQIIVYNDESYGISPEFTVEKDVDLFEYYWKKAKQIEQEKGMIAAVNVYHQAFAFYRGDLLEDLPYEDWVEGSRERLRETWLVILDRLSKHFLEQCRYQICLGICKKMLEKDNCLEDIHRRLMACYMELGMKDLAVRQFKKCREALKLELSVTPGKATVELYEQIRAA